MLSLVISSCVPSPITKELYEADKIMESDPDSALLMLERIDTLTLTKEREKALFSLLYAQAKIKTDNNNIDTLKLGSARNYFNNHPEKNYGLRSNFYSSYTGYINSSYDNAIIWGAKAFLESKASGDEYWIAKSAELLGFILNACHLPNESMKYDSIAYLNYKNAGKITNSVYSAADLAINLAGAKMYNNSDKLFSRLTKKVITEYPFEPSLISHIFDPAIRVKIKLQRWESADSLLRVKRRFDHVLKTSDYLSLAKLKLNNGDVRQTKVYLDSAHRMINNKFDFEDYNIVLKDYARKINNKELENDANSELLKISREVANSRIYHPVHKILTDIIDRDQKSNSALYMEKNFTLLMCCIVILIIGIPLLLFLRHKSSLIRKKLIDKELEHNRSISELKNTKQILYEKEVIINQIAQEIEELKCEIKNNAEDSRSRKEILLRFLNEEIPIIRDLCESIPEFNGPANNIAQRALILKENVELKLSAKNIEWIIESADLVSDGIISRLQEACPNLTENYISLFALFYLGFSSKAAGIILNIKRNAIDQRKKRLKEAIENSDIPDKGDFLSFLGVKK